MNTSVLASLLPFVLLALAMCSAVTWLLLRPLLSSPTTPDMTHDLNPLREQIRQLDALRDCGALDADAHALARAKAERQLLDQVLQQLPPAVPQAARSPWALKSRLGWGLAIGVLALVGAGYVWVGSPGSTGATPPAVAAAPTDTAPHPMAPGDMRAMVDSLATRLAQNPDDVDGWVMLARSYAVLGEHTQALPAFRRALAARPDDAVLLADMADALAVDQGRRIDGEPLQLVERALRIDSRQLKALSLAGTAAFDRRDYAAAIGYWERLQQAGPADHALVRQVADGLAEARQRAGAQPPASGPSAAPLGTAEVAGTVSLAANLAAQAGPDDTVFIFARAAQGPRMPLAVMRRQVRDLPLQFRLDDSLAMSPALKLSSQRQVVVGARISKSGQALPQAGDLVGETLVVDLGRTDLRVQIAAVVQP